MSVYQPICTCTHPGINGCAQHGTDAADATWTAARGPTEAETIASIIVQGGAFTDQDAVTLATAYLHRKENP